MAFRANTVSCRAALSVLCALFFACAGSDGKVGAEGPQGADGEPGAAGGAGPGGADGEPGTNALVEVTPVEPGDDCPAGGQRIQTGIDSDGNGILSTSELTQDTFVCNGQPGADGASGMDGANGADGANGMDGANGANGMDGANGANGMDGANGMSGTDGMNGVNGANGSKGLSSLVKVSLEPAGNNCAVGGQRIDTGLDNGDGGGTADDGVLQTGEIDRTSFVCSFCPDADGDGECDAVDRCPRNARVAAWFPHDIGRQELDHFVADLGSAKNITSVTSLPNTALPTLGELLNRFDAIIIGSNGNFGAEDPNALGDLLAAYVDAGGLVVETMFDHTDYRQDADQEFLGGRWLSGGYNALIGAPQENASYPDLQLTVDAPDPLVSNVNTSAFLGDLTEYAQYNDDGSVRQKMIFIAKGSLNAVSPLGFVQLAHWTYADVSYPAIVVSKHRDKRVLALGMAPIFNFNTTNTDPTTRDFLACSISRLVR